MAKKTNPWAIFDDQAIDLFPEHGFLKDYLTYMSSATDAPLIYHLGVAFSIMATAGSNIDVRVETDRKDEYYDVPMQLWHIIVGLSGDSRKSQAMKIGIKMLRRALKADPLRRNCGLPSDGSIEAWTSHLSETTGTGFIYRTEIASLFEQAGRNYSSGIKTWLLELWEGEEYVRRTLGGGTITVPRPRMNIIGGIPPDTYKSKTHRGDWRAGLLPRFGQFPGIRTKRYRTASRNDRTETHLAQWLERVVVKSVGHIYVPQSTMIQQDNWYVKHIETKKDDFHPEILSCFARFPDRIYKFAALFALSEVEKPIKGSLISAPNLKKRHSIVVNSQHMSSALKVAHVMKENTIELFADMLLTKENEDVRAIAQYLYSRNDQADTLAGISKNSGVSLDYQVLRRLLSAMVEEGDLARIKLSRLPKAHVLREKFVQKGQPPDVYMIP